MSAAVVGLAALLVPAKARAQREPAPWPIRFERAAVEPFLPQSSVYAIHQDRRGFLWFATREGLGRWDGAEMRSWKATAFADDALPSNVVRQLIEDRDGNLWAAAQPADRLPLRVARLAAPDHETVHTLPFDHAIPFLGRDGDAWIVERDSLWRFDGERLVSVRARMRRTEPGSAYMDRAGTVWVSDGVTGIERYPADASPSWIALPDADQNDAAVPRIGGFFEDDRGTLWVLGSGLRRLDPSRTRLVSPERLPAVLDTVGTVRMLQDPDGALWLATLDGVYRFDPELANVRRYSLRLPGDIPTQNWVLGIARDSSGAIWAGTVWGLHRHDPADDVFGFLQHDPAEANTIGSGIVVALHEDATGALWVGTLGGGLNRIDARTGAVLRLRNRAGDPNALGHDWVWSLAGAGGGRVWAGLENGLVLVDPDGPRRVRPIDLGPTDPDWPASVLALHATADGGLWIGADRGLRHRSADGVIRAFPLPLRTDVNAILPDGGALWLATAAGLFRFDPATGASRHFRHDPADPRSLSHDVVITLFRDAAGTLWAGTNAGLSRMLPDSTFMHYDERAGFPSSVIYAIQEDDEARLWLATNRGLVRFDPDADGDVRVYDVEAGVGNVEFNRNAALRTTDGTMYFGGDRGVTTFHPSTLRDNAYRPPVVVTALHRSTRSGTRTTGYVGDGPVVIAPNEYTVAFELAALSYTRPDRNRFAYRLEGFDAQWVDAGTNRLVSYTNLPPGRYVFRARAANEDGAWNEQGVALAVIVQPWFWETRWFRLLALATVIAAAAAVTSTVLRTRHRRQLESLRQQRALEDERARISRDMHDEVGASLTEIAILSELALRRGLEGDGRRNELAKIADRSRHMLDAIGEIIWALDPTHDTPDHLASYLREFAGGFLDSAGLRAELAFEVSPDAAALSSEFRRNVFLILKEALANVARHARARTVRVHLAQHATRLELTIVDDGVGFAAAAAGQASDDRAATSGGRRNGLSNMKRRAQAIGATLAVDSAPGAGTRLRLEAPLPAGAAV